MEAGPRDTAQGTEPRTVVSGAPEQDADRLSPDGPDDTAGVDGVEVATGQVRRPTSTG